jgi:thermitase
MHQPKIRLITALLVLVSLAAGGPWTPPAWGKGKPDPIEMQAPGHSADLFKAGEILVKFRDGVSASAAENVPARFQATRLRALRQNGVDLWRVPEGRELATIKQLAADPHVEYAEPNYVYQASIEPNDPYFDAGKQWAHAVIDSPGAWDLSIGDASTVIAVIDTGIDETHPDLAGKIVAGWDFVDDDGDPHDLNGHGTHVAGIAAAVTNNAAGVAGMNWRARVMPVRVLNQEGQGYNSDIADGIVWAYQHGARVLNLSLGGSWFSWTMQAAIADAYAAGTLVVAAMGNCRTQNPSSCPQSNPTQYPAAYDHVLAVAATGMDDLYTYYSQYGPHCDVAAPGGEMSAYHDPRGIVSTMPTYPAYLTTSYRYATQYDYLQGTSQATPYVSGLAALVWALEPALTPDQVQATIETTATDLGDPGWDPDYGYGRIDARAALEAVTPRVTDLHVTEGITDTLSLTATLRWSAPAHASAIALRYSDVPLGEASWATATPLAAGLPGTADVYTATVPYSGTTVYFALKAQQAAGDWSSLSNNAFWPFTNTYLPVAGKGARP